MILLPYRDNQKYGLISLGGQIVLPAQFEMIYRSDGKTFLIEEDSRIGFLDGESLSTVFVSGWNLFGYSIDCGLVGVSKQGTYGVSQVAERGYMNSNGFLEIDPVFSRVSRFDRFGAIVQFAKKQSQNRIDRQGNVMGEDFDSILIFHQDGIMSGARRAGKGVIINAFGERVGKRSFLNVRQEHEGKIPVRFEIDLVGWVDTFGNTMSQFRAFDIGDHFQDGLIPVENFEGKWGIMNMDQQWVFDPEFTAYIQLGSKRFALGEITGNYEHTFFRLADDKGNFLSETTFRTIHPFQDGIAEISKARKLPEEEDSPDLFNYIDLNGNLLFDQWC